MSLEIKPSAEMIGQYAAISEQIAPMAPATAAADPRVDTIQKWIDNTLLPEIQSKLFAEPQTKIRVTFHGKMYLYESKQICTAIRKNFSRLVTTVDLSADSTHFNIQFKP